MGIRRKGGRQNGRGRKLEGEVTRWGRGSMVKEDGGQLGKIKWRKKEQCLPGCSCELHLRPARYDP